MSRVRAILAYLLSFVALLPLLAWALWIYVIDRAASASSWGDFFERALALLEWLLLWRLAVLLLSLLALVIAGFVDQARRAGALVLAGLALVTLAESIDVIGVGATLESVWIPLCVAIPVANALWQWRVEVGASRDRL